MPNHSAKHQQQKQVTLKQSTNKVTNRNNSKGYAQHANCLQEQTYKLSESADKCNSLQNVILLQRIIGL